MSDDNGQLFDGLDDNEKQRAVFQKEMSVNYRLVVNSDAGRKVMYDILVNHCHFFTALPSGNEQAIGERNIGLAILARLGYGENEFESIINSILSVPIKG